MESKMAIQYKYALNSENQTVYIGDLERTPGLRNQAFTCISCENILIPKLGKIRSKHFAHKYIASCSEETYLHKLVKNLFVQEYQKCLDTRSLFNIELEIPHICNTYETFFGTTCTLEIIEKPFDLTKRYTSVSLETREGEFIPDVLLSNDSGSEKLFVEIAVTHFLSERKVNSSFKIIEIQIKSEEDIDFIHQRLIRQSDPKVKFINLDIKPDVSFHCKDKECLTKMGMFIVFKSGKSIIIWESLTKIHLQLQNPNSSIIYYEILEPVKSYYFSGDTYKRKVVEAHQKGIRIKNCFLCRYHGENRFYDDGKNPIYCKFLKIKCNSNHAAECNYYKPDSKCFPEINEG